MVNEHKQKEKARKAELEQRKIERAEAEQKIAHSRVKSHSFVAPKPAAKPKDPQIRDINLTASNSPAKAKINTNLPITKRKRPASNTQTLARQPDKQGAERWANPDITNKLADIEA